MASISFLRATALPIVLAANLTHAANEMPGIEPGCYPLAEFAAAANQNGMKPVAISNRIVLGTPGKANIFYANEQRYGLNAEGDKPYGTPGMKEICVQTVYKNVRMIDPRHSEIPRWLNAKNGDGIEHTDIKKGYERGGRIVLTAQIVASRPGELENPGETIALFTTARSTATIETFVPGGYANSTADLKAFSLTQHSDHFMQPSGTPLALIKPSGP